MTLYIYCHLYYYIYLLLKNKDKTNYYYNIFLEEVSYELPNKWVFVLAIIYYKSG